MRLTNKQRTELEVIRYFIPSWVDFEPITDTAIEEFFAWSDRGMKIDNVMNQPWTGAKALYWGKKYRDLQTTTYKEDWGTGNITVWDFQEMPIYIAEYFSKSMDKPAIMKIYDGHKAL